MTLWTKLQWAQWVCIGFNKEFTTQKEVAPHSSCLVAFVHSVHMVNESVKMTYRKQTLIREQKNYLTHLCGTCWSVIKNQVEYNLSEI